MRFSPGCSCCAETVSTADCFELAPPCSVVPVRYSLTLSGITNGSCSNCGNYNGTHILTWDSVNCRWCTALSAIPGGGCSDVPTAGTGCGIALTYDFTFSRWLLWLFGPSDRTYELANSSWSCLGTNVMNLSAGSTFNCGGHPATVTLTPA